MTHDIFIPGTALCFTHFSQHEIHHFCSKKHLTPLTCANHIATHRESWITDMPTKMLLICYKFCPNPNIFCFFSSFIFLTFCLKLYNAKVNVCSQRPHNDSTFPYNWILLLSMRNHEPLFDFDEKLKKWRTIVGSI